MKHTNYTISDAAKKLDVEPHVLRYWEDELSLEIHRNNQGHRCYSDKNIRTFCHIKTLKEEGFSLHDIKNALPYLSDITKLDKSVIESLRQKLSSEPDEGCSSIITVSRSCSPVSAPSGDKLGQFREIMNSIISQAISDNNKQLTSMICESTSERVIKEMNYLFRTLDEDEELRIKQLEAAIEAASLARLEAAAGKKNSSSKRGKFFKKNNKKSDFNPIANN